MKGKCSKNISGNCLTSFNAALFTNQQFSPELSPCFLQWEGMLHFPAIHSPASTETPIWRSGWGHPQHRQKYGNTSLAPAQACQEHRGGGCINRTTEILAWLWSTKPILTHQTALDNNLLCKNSSAAANWEQNLMEWLCSDRSQHVTPPHITYKCNPIYKNTLYSCRDIKSPNPATEIFFFLNQQHMILLPSLQSRYPDFLTTHPPAQPFCSHTAGFFWGFSDRAVYSGLFTYTIYALTSGFEFKSRTWKRISLSPPNWVFLLYKHNWYTFTSWTALNNEPSNSYQWLPQQGMGTARFSE